MRSFSQLKILFCTGAFAVGLVVGAIMSATGYAAYMASYRSNWSPEMVGLFGSIGGALFAVRISMDRNWHIAIKVGLAVIFAALLGPASYFLQAHHLGVWFASLPTAVYAISCALLFGGISTIACLIVKDR